MRRPNYVTSSVSAYQLKNMLTNTAGTLAELATNSATDTGNTYHSLLVEISQYKTELRDYVLLPESTRVYIMHKTGNVFIACVSNNGSVYTVDSPFISRSRIDKHTHSLKSMSTKSLPKLVAFIKTLPIADDRDIAHIMFDDMRRHEYVAPRVNGGPFTFSPRYSESRDFATKTVGALAGVVEKVDAGIPVSALDTETIKEALNEVGYYRSKKEYERGRERDTRLDGKTLVMMFEPPRLKGTGVIAFYTQPTGIVYINSATEPDKVPQEIQALYATLTVNGDTDTVGVVDSWGATSSPNPSTPPSIALMLVSEDTVNALFGREKTGEHNNADA